MNSGRRFLYEVLTSGLSLDLISPEDVLQHVTPEVLAHHLPISLKARLLQASLDAERMTPGLVVEVVGIEALVEHAPMPVLWACVRSCAARQLQGQAGDALGASLRLAQGSTAMAVAAGNGPAPAAPSAGDDHLNKTPTPRPRPAALRPGSSPPPRISALSPRSQVLRRPSEPPSSPGVFEAARGEELLSPDFEILDEIEAPTRTLSTGRPLVESDTLRGPKPSSG